MAQRQPFPVVHVFDTNELYEFTNLPQNLMPPKVIAPKNGHDKVMVNPPKQATLHMHAEANKLCGN